mgnify:FL=1|tara:strand:+ start:1118 stop:1405 length:288 start_codon:yes stop_codon:yes gene_type:complete
MEKPGFYITDRKEQVGFRMFFPNGYGISIIFGPECGSGDVLTRKTTTGSEYFCENAEIAVINKEGTLVPFQEDKKVKEYSNPDDLPQILSWAMNR